MPVSQVRGGAGRGGTKVRAGGCVLQCLEACESSPHLHTKREEGVAVTGQGEEGEGGREGARRAEAEGRKEQRSDENEGIVTLRCRENVG